MATRSKDRPSPPAGFPTQTQDTATLLRELVAHLRQNRTQLREEWARRITRAQLLTAMTEAEIFAEATSVYDNYVEALETGTFEALQAYARNLSERIIPRGVETHEVVGIVRLLGATVIVTGLSPEIAQTLVTIGVDLSEMATVGDLQGGIEEAERLLGYKVLPLEELAPKA